MRVELKDNQFLGHSISSHEFSSAANRMAQRLGKKDYLELIPQEPVQDLPKLRGYDLEKGTLVYRGDVKEVGAPRGGTYYIDGNVNLLEGDHYGGVVYVNGNIDKLTDTGGTILIVTGTVGEYDQNHQSVGGLRQPITHSPFLFSLEPIKGISRAYGAHEYGGPGRQTQIEPGMVVDLAKLANWDPAKTLQNALKLCRERVILENQRRMDAIKKITNPKDMADYYEQHYNGYISGYSRGYYNAPSRSSYYDD